MEGVNGEVKEYEFYWNLYPAIGCDTAEGYNEVVNDLGDESEIVDDGRVTVLARDYDEAKDIFYEMRWTCGLMKLDTLSRDEVETFCRGEMRKRDEERHVSVDGTAVATVRHSSIV